MSSDDRGMLMFEIDDGEADDTESPAPGAPATAALPTVTVSVTGPSGARYDFSLPRSEVEGSEVRLGELLLMAVEQGADDFDGDAEELSRRRIFARGVGSLVAGADPSGGEMRYLMTLGGDGSGGDLEARLVQPATPVRISEGTEQDQRFEVIFAPYHTGGR